MTIDKEECQTVNTQKDDNYSIWPQPTESRPRPNPRPRTNITDYSRHHRHHHQAWALLRFIYKLNNLTFCSSRPRSDWCIVRSWLFGSWCRHTWQ